MTETLLDVSPPSPWNGSQDDRYRNRDEMQIEVPRNRDGTFAP